jgi:alkyl sulfatase BDS1-like metallo-beta-lactamase superfamily hydrolase
VNHLVFADAANTEARELQADALEQMGYQAESGPWRAFYLTGAQELRNPIAASPTPRQAAMAQLPRLPGGFLLDSLSVRLNGPKGGAETLKLGVRLSDTDESFLVEVENGVMRHYADRTAPGATLIGLSRATLVQLVSGAATLDGAIAAGEVAVEGDPAPVARFLGWLDRFDFWFKIIEP